MPKDRTETGRLAFTAATMIACCALIALTTLIAKTLGRGPESDALHPLQVTAGRFCFAFAAIAPVVFARRVPFAGTAWRSHGLRSVVGWAGVGCLFTAAAMMPLAEATAISFLSPIATMILAIPLLGETVGRWRWAAAALAASGAAVVMQPGSDAFQVAAVIALAAALLMGFEAILIKRLSATEPALRILFVNNLFGSMIAVAAMVFVWRWPTPEQWLLLVVLGATMAAAQSLFILSMKQGEASYAIPFFYATLVFAAVYDYIAFGDAPGAAGWIGAALIVGGALLLAWRENVRARMRGQPT